MPVRVNSAKVGVHKLGCSQYAAAEVRSCCLMKSQDMVASTHKGG